MIKILNTPVPLVLKTPFKQNDDNPQGDLPDPTRRFGRPVPQPKCYGDIIVVQNMDDFGKISTCTRHISLVNYKKHILSGLICENYTECPLCTRSTLPYKCCYHSELEKLKNECESNAKSCVECKKQIV